MVLVKDFFILIYQNNVLVCLWLTKGVSFIVWFILFNGISTCVTYLTPKQSSQKQKKMSVILFNQQLVRIRRLHIFPKSISPIVDFFEQLVFELAYFDASVQHFNHYATGTPPPILKNFAIILISSITDSGSHKSHDSVSVSPFNGI